MSEPQVPPPPRGVQLSNTVIIGVLLVLSAALAVQEIFGGEGLAGSRPAPDITLSTLEGQPLQLSALKGHVVLLNFWATWCSPCNEEMPDLVQLAKAYQARGVVFVASNQEAPDEARGAVKGWLSQHPEAAPYVAFGDEASAEAFRVEALPTTYVIDAQGRIVDSARGRVAAWQVKQWLDDALAAK